MRASRARLHQTGGRQMKTGSGARERGVQHNTQPHIQTQHNMQADISIDERASLVKYPSGVKSTSPSAVMTTSRGLPPPDLPLSPVLPAALDEVTLTLLLVEATLLPFVLMGAGLPREQGGGAGRFFLQNGERIEIGL